MSSYPHFAEARGVIPADRAATFSYLDDQANLSAHMDRPSAMMLGSSMDIEMEADHTRRVGSRFGFTGRVLGLRLAVREVVIARDPPVSKAWETTEEPTLWVIGRYRMGFELSPNGSNTTLRVYIAYALPPRGLSSVLGLLFGAFYARWCTKKMVVDARRHFAAPAPHLEAA